MVIFPEKKIAKTCFQLSFSAHVGRKICCTKLRSHVNFLLSGNEKPLKEIFLVEFTKKREKFRIA